MAVGTALSVDYYDGEALVIALERNDVDAMKEIIANKIRVDFETAKAA